MPKNAVIVCRHGLSSLVRQRPLACRLRCAGSRPLLVSVHPRLPSSSSPPPPPTAADAPGRSPVSAAALAVPPPRELSLSRHSSFGITAVDAATAAATNNGDHIPPPRSQLRRPANLVVVTLLSAAVRHQSRHFLSAADTLVISHNLVDCCVIAICSQCFVATGDTVGNPAATKKGDTVTCHCAVASRQEALPESWEVGVYFHCCGRGEPSNISTGGKLGPPF